MTAARSHTGQASSTAGEPVVVLPLVPEVPLPHDVTARQGALARRGMDGADRCRPHADAAALGFAVPAPFAFGCCLPEDVPVGARAFRSPEGPTAGPADGRVVYVVDAPAQRFRTNGFAARDADGTRWLIPGLGFFERRDQSSLVRIHLPYLWRTAPGVSLLFGPPINAEPPPLRVFSGVVETDWFGDAVELVAELPRTPVHVRRGQPLAQVVPLRRDAPASLQVVSWDDPQGEAIRNAARRWQESRAASASAYRQLASGHG